jgi:hypothetical protein
MRSGRKGAPAVILFFFFFFYLIYAQVQKHSDKGLSPSLLPFSVHQTPCRRLFLVQHDDEGLSPSPSSFSIQQRDSEGRALAVIFFHQWNDKGLSPSPMPFSCSTTRWRGAVPLAVVSSLFSTMTRGCPPRHCLFLFTNMTARGTASPSSLHCSA